VNPHGKQMRTPLYPLRFEPIHQYRPWGGRRLANLLSAPPPGDGPISETSLLSDRDDHPSLVASGPLKGRAIGQLLDHGTSGGSELALSRRIAAATPNRPVFISSECLQLLPFDTR
jgi:hypothetical protein